MTRADKWQKRPIVKAYWDFKAECRLRGVSVPMGGSHVTFVMPMPKSWGKKKRLASDGQAHQQTPDCDNMLKGLLDALYDDDSCVWDIRVTKIWGVTGEIRVEHA